MSIRFPVSSLLVLVALPAAALGEGEGGVPTVTAHAVYAAGGRAETRPPIITTATYNGEIPRARADTFVLSNSERIELREQITAAATEIYAGDGERRALPRPAGR